MKRMRALEIVGAGMFFAMCGGAIAQDNAVPFLNQSLSPASIAPGSKTFTLTVNGSGFASSAVVNWNGSSRLTEVISSSQLKATIEASDVAKPQTAWITVTNSAPGGGTSNVIFFPVRDKSSSLGMAVSEPFAGATAVAIGDFNNDGKLDVAWTASNGLNVSLGNGNGTFQPPIVTSGFGGSLIQLVTGDFNGDGNLDLALGGDWGVTVLLGDGKGGFTESSYIDAFTGGNAGIGVADFNHDGRLDIYIAGWEGPYDEFEILTGNGDGTFGYSYGYVTGSPQGQGDFGILSGAPAVGDFNQDGYLDLAIGGYPNGNDGEIEIFLGNASGAFTQGTTISGVYAINVATADVNNDGKLDLITDYGCVLLGNGDGTFQSCNALPFSGEIGGIGDFTGNHILDVVNGIVGLESGVAVDLGAGNGTFSTDFTFLGPYIPGAVGDFNNDGRLDIVASSGFDGYLLLQTTVDLTPFSLGFGNQNVGTSSAAQTATLTNVGTSALEVGTISISGSGSKNFSQTNNCSSSLAAGASCTISVTFAPAAGGKFSASLGVSYKGTGSPQSVALSGTGVTPPTVTLLPTSLSYATQLFGTSSPAQTATLSNTGDQAVSISNIAVSGPFTETNNCPRSLGEFGACQIQIVFAPAGPGAASGTLSVTDNATGSPQQVALSGVGTVITLSPIAVNFGSQSVGTLSSAAPITLSNVGTTGVSITSIAITGADPRDFLEANNCGSTLAANSGCTIEVKFRPTAAGARSAAVSISDNGGASPQTVALSGTGTGN